MKAQNVFHIAARALMSRTFVFFASVFACLLAQYWCFSKIHGLWDLWFFNASNYGADALLFCALLLLLPSRVRGWALIWPWLTSIWLLASAVYYRYSCDFLSLRIIFSAESYNSLVFNAAMPLLKFSDVVWLLFPLLPIAVLLFYRRHCGFERVGVSVKAVVLVIAMLMFAANYAAIAGYRAGWLRDMGHNTADAREIIRRNFLEPESRINYLRDNGHVLFTAWQISDLFHSPAVELDEATRRELEDYLAACGNKAVSADSIAEKRNLIFIVVESLDSYAADLKIDGIPVCPVLDSLSRLAGTLFAPAMVPQIAGGASADGQLIYNTGLHPLTGDYTAMDFGSNRYISLASLLKGYRCEEIIGEDRAVWNHAATSTSYGYDVLHDRKSVSADPERNATDSEIFGFAAQRVDSLQEPFMLFVTTLTSHFPYGADVPDDGLIRGRDTRSRYLRTIRYFDCCLGGFLRRLHESGKADNTVVVIASDHDAPMDIMHDVSSDSIMFMALNTPLTRRVTWTFGQIDVFPAVLDIMGVNSRWRGLGHSFVTDSIGAAVGRGGKLCGKVSKAREDSLRRAMEISEKIIRTDYFKHVDYEGR